MAEKRPSKKKGEPVPTQFPVGPNTQILAGNYPILETDPRNDYPVNFDESFASAPLVLLTVQQSAGQSGSFSVSDATPTGFTIFSNGKAVGYSINWIAIGEKPKIEK